MTTTPDLTVARRLALTMNEQRFYFGGSELAGNVVAALADELERLRADAERTARNRDMWKGQVERQAERLQRLHEVMRLTLRAADTYGASVELFDVVNEKLRAAMDAGPAPSLTVGAEPVARVTEFVGVIRIEAECLPHTGARMQIGDMLYAGHQPAAQAEPVAPTDREATADELAVYRSISAGYFKDSAQAEPVALEAVYETIILWDEGGGKRSRRELARRIAALYGSNPAAQGIEAALAAAKEQP